jgi:cytochrome c-type biogenesis protein CcmH
VTAFVIAAAVLALLALGFVLRPLWRDKPLAGFGMVATLALATALLYTQIGTPKALDPAQLRAPETLADAVAQLEAELKRDPSQVEGWLLLGRAYAAEDRLAEARDALAKAVKLSPDDPDLLVEAAQARAMAAGNQFDAPGTAMLQRALSKQPMHQRARWFLGIAQRQSKQSAEAAKTWEPLLAVVDPRTAASLREQIDAARRDAGLEPLPAALAAAPTTTSTGITVKVALAPALTAKLPANATLFVIARQPNGPPMPVAVEKLAATGFPRVVTLDDGDSPMPTMKLSQLAQVEVTARVSASGDAIPHAGDFEATAKASGNSGTIELVIDRVRQ